MPIKPESKLIFIHVPKTGGSSIEKVLGLHPSDVEDNEYYLSGGKKQLQHLTLSELIKLKCDEFDLTSFTAVGIVRNPIDRMISEYKWRKKIGHKIIEGLDINDFVKKIYDAKKENQRLDSHFTEQNEFFKLTDSSAIKDVRIFKFEDGFEKIGLFLADYLDLPEMNIGKVNHTEQIKLDNQLSVESIALIKQMFSADFQTFYGGEDEL